MCRMAGWIGAPVPLSTLLYDPPHSLSRQAWEPREMLYGNVNLDGTGVAWWPDGDAAEPLRYVTPSAPWNDANLPHLASRLTARVAIAAVRSATPGIPFGPGNVAPFTIGDLALTHNGFVQGFRQGMGRKLLARLSDRAFDAYDAVSDSLTLGLLVRDQLDEGAGLGEALARTIGIVAEVLEGSGHGATLNLLASDGRVLAATRASIGLGQNSLYVSETPQGIRIASEALDEDGSWHGVPAQTLVEICDGRLDLRPL